MTASTIPATLTPYDAGERLEPKLWQEDGDPHLDDPDRYGRVDFDDDEGATIASAHIQRLPSGAFTLVVTRVSDVRLVVDVDGEHALLVNQHEPSRAPIRTKEAPRTPLRSAVAELMKHEPEVLANAIVRAFATAGSLPEWNSETIELVLDELQRSTRGALPDVGDTDYWTPVIVEALLADAHEAQAAMAEEEIR